MSSGLTRDRAGVPPLPPLESDCQLDWGVLQLGGGGGREGRRERRRDTSVYASFSYSMQSTTHKYQHAYREHYTSFAHARSRTSLYPSSGPCEGRASPSGQEPQPLPDTHPCPPWSAHACMYVHVFIMRDEKEERKKQAR